MENRRVFEAVGYEASGFRRAGGKFKRKSLTPGRVSYRVWLTMEIVVVLVAGWLD